MKEFRTNSEAGGYMAGGDVVKITHLVRQAVELGADLIKADPTDDVSVYHKVIETAGGTPMLVRGGNVRYSFSARDGTIDGLRGSRSMLKHELRRRFTPAVPESRLQPIFPRSSATTLTRDASVPT